MPTFSYTQDMMKTVDRVPSENMSVGSTWAFPCRVFHGGSTVKIRIDLRNFLLPSLHHPHVLRRITQLEALSNFIHRQRGVRQQVDQSFRSRFVWTEYSFDEGSCTSIEAFQALYRQVTPGELDRECCRRENFDVEEPHGRSDRKKMRVLDGRRRCKRLTAPVLHVCSEAAGVVRNAESQILDCIHVGNRTAVVGLAYGRANMRPFLQKDRNLLDSVRRKLLRRLARRCLCEPPASHSLPSTRPTIYPMSSLSVNSSKTVPAMPSFLFMT